MIGEVERWVGVDNVGIIIIAEVVDSDFIVVIDIAQGF